MALGYPVDCLTHSVFLSYFKQVGRCWKPWFGSHTFLTTKTTFRDGIQAVSDYAAKSRNASSTAISLVLTGDPRHEAVALQTFSLIRVAALADGRQAGTLLLAALPLGEMVIVQKGAMATYRITTTHCAVFALR